MFTSTTTGEYSIMECPPIRPLVMDTTTPKWKCNNIELAPNCPRCASSNTKFCYYNNYSLSQPRYFCKGCRRYWTKGGSLRNVPIGGGCRKTRRSRATRQSGSGNFATPTLSSISVGSSNESESGTNIDMAAVFAKYLNQNLEYEESSSPGVSSGSSDNVQASSMDSQMEDITMLNYQTPLGLIDGVDDQMQQIVPQFSMQDEINGQDFLYHDYNSFDLQRGTFGDEIATDLSWSNDVDLPDLGSQQSTVQVDQDSGLFSSDYQLRICPNLGTDNWGSFDLSTYELFSRP